jgi:hypothetical protein
MAAAGIVFGTHGLAHATLTGVSQGRVEIELRGVLVKLRQRGHARNGLLAYLGRTSSRDVVCIALRAGCCAAFTTCCGLVDRDSGPLQLPHRDISSSSGEFLQLVPGGIPH